MTNIIENRRLAQGIINQLFNDMRFELLCAKNNAKAALQAKSTSEADYWLGQMAMAERTLKFLGWQAEEHRLRIPPENAPEALKLVVDNTKK